MNNEPEMKLTGVMHFDNRAHLTYTLGDTEFISMRRLIDQLGMDWRRQKIKLLTDDNVFFYGTLMLEEGNIVQPPCKYAPKNSLLPSNCSDKPQKIATFCTDDAQKETVFIMLKRVYLYLARISIGHVMGSGKNQTSAEYLLSLQEEWADALHDYETKGFAVKKSHVQDNQQNLRNLLAITRTKLKVEAVAERKLLTSLQEELAQKMGHSYQPDLLDDM